MSKATKLLSNLPRRRATIADVYPNLSTDEQQEAAYNLRRYIAVSWRIFERMRREQPQILTEALKTARLRGPKRQNQR